MRKRSILVGLVVVVVILWAANSYAEGMCGIGSENCPIKGFFNSVGGFLYNALPWNWGNWAGK